MTLTLLDLYNTAASQEWSMYDKDAVSDSEFEDSLVLAINKSIIEIFASYDFPFRERTHLILTIPKVDAYELPNGLIKKDSTTIWTYYQLYFCFINPFYNIYLRRSILELNFIKP